MGAWYYVVLVSITVAPWSLNCCNGWTKRSLAGCKENGKHNFPVTGGIKLSLKAQFFFFFLPIPSIYTLEGNCFLLPLHVHSRGSSQFTEGEQLLKWMIETGGLAAVKTRIYSTSGWSLDRKHESRQSLRVEWYFFYFHIPRGAITGQEQNRREVEEEEFPIVEETRIAGEI